MPKLFLIACEASGDSHTAALVRELKKQRRGIEYRGLGGEKMAAEGVELLQDMTQMSALGFGDVVRQYFTYRKIFYRALDEVKKWKPDALLLTDSPAFNLRFAKKIRQEGLKLPVIYYISPQLWAWGGNRIHTVKKVITKMIVILPFEKELYDKAGVPCDFVGHPLLDHVRISKTREELRKEFEISPDQKAIGLLPGSRSSEVRRILPVMLQSALILKKDFPNTVFFLGESSNVAKSLYNEILAKYPLSLRRYQDRFYDHVTALDFALVTSGTATLEVALTGTPFFLLYKTSWSTYFLGKHLIQVPFLGIVNLLAGKKVIPEFIQNDAHPETIAHEARVFLQNPELSRQMKEEFLNVRGKLGKPDVSLQAAQKVLDYLVKEN